MQSGEDHEPAKVLQTRPIHMQSDHGCASERSFSFNSNPALSPFKMPAPLLTAGIEEADRESSSRILSMSLRSFVPVAALARESEILEARRATLASRQNMFGRVR